MSGIIRTKPIVTNGLVFYVDAANPISYVSGGTNCNDLSVTNLNGVLENGVGYDADNLGSFDFDGIDDYIDCTNNPIFDFDYGDTSSIEAWVKFDDLSSFGFLVSKWLAVPPADALAFFLGISGNKLTFRFFANGGGTSGIIVDSLISLNVGEWYHLVATYDGSGNANGINLYINNTVSNNIIRNNATGSVLNTEPLQIGGQDTFFTNGKISNVKIYNRELSQSEVSQNYNALKYRFI